VSAGFSPANTPHLAPAVELENALFDLTVKLPSLGLPTTLDSSADLDKLVPHIESAIDNVNLWQYYVFDVQASVKEVATAVESGKIKTWSGETVAGKSIDQLAEIAKSTPDLIQNYRAWSSRFCTKVDAEAAAGFIQSAYPNDNATDLASKWGKVVDIINVDLYNECNEDVKAAKDSVIGRIKYTRLEEGGPKMGEINKA
jgi:glycogen debranching enzyme